MVVIALRHGTKNDYIQLFVMFTMSFEKIIKYTNINRFYSLKEFIIVPQL